MKKLGICLLIASLIASFCVANLTVFAEEENLVIDATTITGGNFNVNSNGTECSGLGQYASLGNIDLSKYGEVVFSYASDAGAVFTGDKGDIAFAITKNGAIQDSNGDAVESADVICKISGFKAVASSWVPEDIKTDINSDYNGEVFFAVYHPTPGNCALLKKITFIAKSEPDKTPEQTPEATPETTPDTTPEATPETTPEQTLEPTQKPSENNPSTGDVAVFAALCFAVIAVAVLAIIIRANKKKV